MMKSLTIVAASAVVVVSAGISFNVELDGMPMNNLLNDNGGKPSSEQYHAQKSRRMAERRARVSLQLQMLILKFVTHSNMNQATTKTMLMRRYIARDLCRV